MLYAYDYIDGALAKDGAVYAQFIFLLAIGLLMTIIPAIYSLYLFVKFKKSTGKKFLSKPWFISISVAQIVSVITACLGWLFYYGEFILGSGEEAGQLGFAITLSLVVITYVITVAWYIILLFVPQFIWLLIEEETVHTISSNFKREKIQAIIKDEEKGKVYINYLESKFTLKKIAYPLSSTMGQFVLQEIESFGVKLTVGSQQEYYQSKGADLKSGYMENIKKAKDEVAEKAVKPASLPTEEKTSKTTTTKTTTSKTTTSKTTASKSKKADAKKDEE